MHYLEGNITAAEEGLKNSLDVAERSYGSSHLCFAQYLADLATYYCKIKKYKEVKNPRAIC